MLDSHKNGWGQWTTETSHWGMTARGNGDLRLENRFPIRRGHHPVPASPHRKGVHLLMDCTKSLVRTDMGGFAKVTQKSRSGQNGPRHRPKEGIPGEGGSP